ncbi:MAG: WG repeat-containing protein [Pedobacter sp.]|nr:MAG: WG repeat-containing protein [Pedobacter sp.]
MKGVSHHKFNHPFHTIFKLLKYEVTAVVLLLFYLVMISNSCYAQTSPAWYRYDDPKTELAGYKDSHGVVKISPRFGGLTNAPVFKNVIAVTDQRSNTSYYLLKNGKMVGKDSLYVYDMTFDCEQEGKIRFRDPITDKTGFFNAEGKIAIPAIFNDAKAFHNGLSLVLYNGKRVCPDGSTFDKQNPCEHWAWDGITALIDVNGNILADSLDYGMFQNINWNSMQISEQPADTTLRISVRSKDNRYLTFVNYEKEFGVWFNNQYLANVANRLKASSFDVVCVEGLDNNRLRKFYSRKEFNSTYGTVLRKKLQRITTKNTQIIPDELNYMIYTQKLFKKYLTDCGDANVAEYPLFDVVLSYLKPNGEFKYQEYFSFLRSTSGYKLIGVAWKDRR